MPQTTTDEKRPSSVGLTLAELNFCYQYCAFAASSSDLQPAEEQVHAFPRRSIMPTDIQYPSEWSTNKELRDQAADRFIQLTQHLQATESEERPTLFFNMANFKRLAWYFAVGFIGTQLSRYIGSNTAPTAAAI